MALQTYAVRFGQYSPWLEITIGNPDMYWSNFIQPRAIRTEHTPCLPPGKGTRHTENSSWHWSGVLCFSSGWQALTVYCRLDSLLIPHCPLDPFAYFLGKGICFNNTWCVIVLTSQSNGVPVLAEIVFFSLRNISPGTLLCSWGRGQDSEKFWNPPEMASTEILQ